MKLQLEVFGQDEQKNVGIIKPAASAQSICCEKYSLHMLCTYNLVLNSRIGNKN